MNDTTFDSGADSGPGTGSGTGSGTATAFAASRSALRSQVERAVRALDDPPRGDELGDRDLDPSLPRTRARRPAAVLVPIVERPHGHTVLLTRRTDHLHDHPGQVAFPGGRLDDTDRGPVDAALRETAEEIGLGREHVELAGLLDGYETVTGYGVTPVVAFVRPGFVLTLDTFEVAEAFEVPLAFFLDAASCRIDSGVRGGLRRRYYAFEYADRYIWGATAGMLVNLRRRVAGDAGWSPPGGSWQMPIER